MNDEFLYKIRIEPPPEFLKRLKSRLDLQPSPTPPPKKHSTTAKVLTGLLLSGAVFALTLFILNRGEPDPSANTAPMPQQEPVATLAAPSKSAEVTANETAGDKVKNKKEIPPNFTAITSSSLEPYFSYLTDTYFKPRGKVAKIVATSSPAEALVGWCNDHATAKSEQPGATIALLPRHLTQSESEDCARNIGALSETAVGFQAFILARSKLYGTFNLTPVELFMALAAEVPDPSRPDRLIPNPNTTWSDINPALEREPIELLGPDRSSTAGLALREILLEGVCRSIPALANAKECPDLRSDAAYTEVTNPSDIAQQLQTKPNALGIFPWGTPVNPQAVEFAPVGGVMPSRKTISNGTYPGARALYLYMNSASGARPLMDYLNASLPYDSYNLFRLAIIPPERSQP